MEYAYQVAYEFISDPVPRPAHIRVVLAESVEEAIALFCKTYPANGGKPFVVLFVNNAGQLADSQEVFL